MRDASLRRSAATLFFVGSLRARRVELDTKGSEAPAITVALVGLEDREPPFTHVVTELTCVWVQRAQLRFVIPQPEIRKILRITSLAPVLDTYDTLDGAIAGRHG